MNRLILLCLILLTTMRIHAQTNTPIPQTPQQIMELGRGTANTLDWNPAGDVLAVGGARGLWLYDGSLTDLAYFEELGEVTHLAWSPSSNMIATRNLDGILQIWSVAANPYRLMLLQSWSIDAPGEYPALFFAWSPDGKKLAVVDETGARILDVKTGETLVTIPDLVFTLTWSPDSTQIAGVVDLGAEVGNQVRVWDVSKGAVVHTYIDPNPDLFWSGIRWSPDRSTLVGVTSLPATLRAWSVATDDKISSADTAISEFSAYFDMWWVNEGRRLVTISRFISGSAGNSFELWDTTTWTRRDGGFLQAAVRDIAKHPHVDEWALLTWDGQLMIWGLQEAKTLRIRSVYEQPPHLLAWSEDSHHLATADSSGGHIYIWDLTAPAHPKSQTAAIPYFDWRLDELRWSANNDVLIGFLSIPEITAPGAFPIAFVMEWDGQTGEYIDAISETPGYVSVDGSDIFLPSYTWNGDFTRVATVMGSEPITISAVVGNNGFISPDEEITALDVADNPYAINWSPDSTMLAVISRDSQNETSAWVYDARTGNLMNRLRPTFPTTLYDMSWSPDSSMVALAGRRGIAGSGEIEYRLDIEQIDVSSDEAEHVMTVLDMDTTFYHAWHPESRAIAVTTSSGIAIYPIESEPIGVDAASMTIVPDVQAVALAWSPDGEWLAGSLNDGTVRVWAVGDVIR